MSTYQPCKMHSIGILVLHQSIVLVCISFGGITPLVCCSLSLWYLSFHWDYLYFNRHLFDLSLYLWFVQGWFSSLFAFRFDIHFLLGFLQFIWLVVLSKLVSITWCFSIPFVSKFSAYNCNFISFMDFSYKFTHCLLVASFWFVFE